jgi:hypothetical protein
VRSPVGRRSEPLNNSSKSLRSKSGGDGSRWRFAGFVLPDFGAASPSICVGTVTELAQTGQRTIVPAFRREIPIN